VQLAQLPAGVQQKGMRPLLPLQPLVGLPSNMQGMLPKAADAAAIVAATAAAAQQAADAAAAGTAAAEDKQAKEAPSSNGDAPGVGAAAAAAAAVPAPAPAPAAPATSAPQSGSAPAASGAMSNLGLLQQVSGAPVGLPVLPGMASMLQQSGLAGTATAIPVVNAALAANLQSLQGHQLPAFIQPHQLALLQQGFSLPLANGHLGNLGQVQQAGQQQQAAAAAAALAAAQTAAAGAAQAAPAVPVAPAATTVPAAVADAAAAPADAAPMDLEQLVAAGLVQH
jgi:hypothetical protein